MLTLTLWTFQQNYARSYRAHVSQNEARLRISAGLLADSLNLRAPILGINRPLASIDPSTIKKLDAPIQLNRSQIDGLAGWTELTGVSDVPVVKAATYKAPNANDNGFLYIYLETAKATFERRLPRPGWLTNSDYFVLKTLVAGQQPNYYLIALEDKRDLDIVARVAAFDSTFNLTPRIEETTIRNTSIVGGLYDRPAGAQGNRLLLRVPLPARYDQTTSIALGIGGKTQTDVFRLEMLPELFASTICAAIAKGAPYAFAPEIDSAIVAAPTIPNRLCSVPNGQRLNNKTNANAWRFIHRLLVGSSYGTPTSKSDNRLMEFVVPLRMEAIPSANLTVHKFDESLLSSWRQQSYAQLVNATISVVGLGLLIVAFYFGVLKRISRLSRSVLAAIKARKTIALPASRSFDEIEVLARALRLWGRQADVQANRVDARNRQLAAKSSQIEGQNAFLERQAAELSEKTNELTIRNKELLLANTRHERIAKQIRHDIYKNLLALRNYNTDVPRARDLLENVIRVTDDIISERHTALDTKLTDISRVVNEWVRNVSVEQNLAELSATQFEAGLFAWAEEDRLGEVFNQLLDNALAFRDPGTSIVVDVVPRADGVRIIFSNIGPPILEENLQRIFEHGVSIRSQRQAGNLGSGLHTARQYVSGMGGVITAENSPGRRINFLIDLK